MAVARAWDDFDDDGVALVLVGNPHSQPATLGDGCPVAEFRKPDVKPRGVIGCLSKEEVQEGALDVLMTSAEAPSQQDWLDGMPPGQEFVELGYENQGKKEDAQQRKQRVLAEANLPEELSAGTLAGAQRDD